MSTVRMELKKVELSKSKSTTQYKSVSLKNEKQHLVEPQREPKQSWYSMTRTRGTYTYTFKYTHSICRNNTFR